MEAWPTVLLRAVLESMGRIHGRAVHRSRVLTLARWIAPMVLDSRRLVDVGCGDGRIARAVADEAPGLEVEGFDVLARPVPSGIPTRIYDGERLPLTDSSVDAVMAIDVIHHAKDPAKLLAELCRVCRVTLIIKDHRLARPAARPILSFMDWISNAPYGVHLPGNYWTEERWISSWAALGLRVVDYQTNLGLYPRLAQPWFEMGLHFLARLEKTRRD